ncbi:YtxH domain-containing protein [Oceanobacillus damuensis]|uniref:YtxH domain-containing protein n=1 Tax=Oceanobacillus damuensis TaxID=937928 RepID=UPI000834E636|nr:YtxH domain-containing protein [Oceanobacillus damuensis]
MGKRKLLLGITVGAAVGGVTALFDRDTREYAKEKLVSARTSSSYFMNHPSEAIHNLRDTFDQLNQTFANGAENAINALEQVETTLDKVTNKKEVNEIE